MIILLQSFVDDTTVKAINKTLQESGLSLNTTDATNLPEPMMTVIGRLKILLRLMIVINMKIFRFGVGMIILACAVWLLSWVFVTCLNWAAARQVQSAPYFVIQTRFILACNYPGVSCAGRILACNPTTRYWLV